MFDQFERELLPKETRLLSSKIQHWRMRIRRSRRNGFIFWLILCGGTGLLFFLAKSETHRLAAFFCMVVVFGLITLWSGISVSKDFRRRVGKLEQTLARNRAVVTRIVSDRMIEFEEVEDEGACYAFQVTEDRIAFVVGQDYYPSAKFPNSDFDLIGIGPEEVVEKRGQKLVPLRQIKANIKKDLQIPDHLAVIEGKLENLEELLRPAQKSQT